MEGLDVDLNLLHHARVELRAVAEREERLEQHEHRRRDQRLVEAVEQCGLAALKHAVANEL